MNADRRPVAFTGGPRGRDAQRIGHASTRVRGDGRRQLVEHLLANGNMVRTMWASGCCTDLCRTLVVAAEWVAK